MIATDVQRHFFNVDDYYKIYNAGVFSEDDRIELIEGEIIHMTPIGSQHAACINRLTNLFAVCFKGRAIISVQNPLRLSQTSEPEPDVVILKPQDNFYAKAHPQSSDVFLAVEVADSSLPYDKDIKLPLYAKYGIPEVWIINLSQDQIEAYSEPVEGSYRNNFIYRRNQTIFSAAFEEDSFAVNEILP